ncbi:MAG: HypC/HybG/HupF family hydrogenase formation chaperone [Methanosarcinaceae archaeon]|jgi:hydrogenase expression/formation protein HypC|nr:HypC/HybG/HupF family hydrogenase formation chaperone [Methanosarcinaceae archaeon]NKQ39479.1 HypC/HybG/HupF family hydrogenase formation chaperone [Methanosarcinales archaeon]
MCIAIPSKVLSLKDEKRAIVDMGGIKKEISLDLLKTVDESIVGKYVLVHVGYAISVISEDDGDEILKLLSEF